VIGKIRASLISIGTQDGSTPRQTMRAMRCGEQWAEVEVGLKWGSFIAQSGGE
jgi:hypothetical protein